MFFGGNLFSILFLFFLIKFDNTIRAASVIKLGLRREYQKLIKDIPGTGNPIISNISNYDALSKYFESDPVVCLNGVFEMGDYAFNELFFSVIWNGVSNVSVRIFSVPRVLPSGLFHIENMCKGITEMAMIHLFTLYKSETEMAEGFKIIEVLIKFAKNYIELFCYRTESAENSYYRGNLRNLSKPIEDLKFVMRSFDFTNGTIDDTQFFILISRLGPTSLKGYDENLSGYYLLLATHLNNIIKRRDFTLYESKYPELPL